MDKGSVMKTASRKSILLASAAVATTLIVAAWAFATTHDDDDSDYSDDSCEWKFVGNHTSTDAKGHYWNECTGELYYVVGTEVTRAPVPSH